MRVCVISGSYPPMPDGVGDYTQQFFRELVRQVGEDNAVLLTTQVEHPVENGARHLYVVHAWTLANMPHVVRAVAAARPDVINLQYPTYGFKRHLGATALPLLLRWRFPQLPLVATLHEFTSRTTKGRYRLLMSLLPCSRILLVNPVDRLALRAMSPRLVSRLRYLPVGPTVFPQPLQREEAGAIKQRFGWEQDVPILAYFGVLRPTKGIESLIESFRLIQSHLPHARLLLLGHADELFLAGKLMPLLRRAGLTDRVFIAGRCTDAALSEYFAATDLCVLPFPDGVTPRRTSFMAALQAEQAIITTRPQYPFDEVRDGENVLLVPPGDSGALADGIIRLAGDAVLRARLRRGSVDLKNTFRWDRIVAGALTVFGDALAAMSH